MKDVLIPAEQKYPLLQGVCTHMLAYDEQLLCSKEFDQNFQHILLNELLRIQK